MTRAGLAGAVFAASLGMGCGARARTDAYETALAAIGLGLDEADHAGREAAGVRALRAAVAAVSEAREASDPASPTMRRAALLDAAARGDLDTASLLAWFWRPSPDDADGFAAWATVLAATGRRAEAVDAAWAAARVRPDERERWIRLWYDLMADDPTRFPPPLADAHAGGGFDALEPFGSQSSILLKVLRDGTPVAVFKPHQILRHQSFRGEVAAYRLCQLIRCTFAVPTSREMWMDEGELRELVGEDRLVEAQREGRRRLIVLDEDGGRAVYGVVKRWVPDFTRFPIEYADVWRPLVSAGVTAEELRDLPLDEALAPLVDRPRGFYREIVARSSAMTAYDLARQLSELHVFDLLINNFDRYQPEAFGMNAHWAAEGFVSIDNGASFFLPDEFSWRASRRRVLQVEVFPRDMIDAIRWMDTEAAFELLFPPNPHFGDERLRFEAFLERRQWLLDYVDRLVAEHGEDAVYVFE